MTTLLQEYFSIKRKYPDAILLFRVGDFYEAYNEDAKIVALHSEMMLQLTAQNKNVEALASLSHYALDNALRILTRAGYKVAICDQLEAAKAGPMKRGATGLFPEK